MQYPRITLCNNVGTGDTGVTINCALVTYQTSGRYDPSSFPAVVLKVKENDTCGQVFGTGKIVAAGCPDSDTAILTCMEITSILNKKLGANCRVYNFRITNKVLNIDLGFPINVSSLVRDIEDAKLPGVLLNHTPEYRDIEPFKRKMTLPTYRPELFPGFYFSLIDYTALRSGNAKHCLVTITLFKTGKGVAAGLHRNEQIELVREFVSRLQPYQDGPMRVGGHEGTDMSCDQASAVSQIAEWDED